MENLESPPTVLAILKKIKNDLLAEKKKTAEVWKGNLQDFKLVLFLGCIKEIMTNLNSEIVENKENFRLFKEQLKANGQGEP